MILRKAIFAVVLSGLLGCGREQPQAPKDLNDKSPYGQSIQQGFEQADRILQEKGQTTPPTEEQIGRALEVLKKTPGISEMRVASVGGRPAFVGMTSLGSPIESEIFSLEFAELLDRIGKEVAKAGKQDEAFARAEALAKGLNGVTVERASYLGRPGIRVLRLKRSGFIDISAIPAR
jgi:hypothetical protein